MQMPSKPARAARDAVVAGAGWLWRTSRQHWVMSALLLAGLVLRVITQIAYRPALFYIDTLKYLFNAFPGTDPVGYKVPLYTMVFFGGLPGVAAVQHLLGLAMAAGLYVLLLRRGCARWLAALATAPLLLDAYQLQIEQMIMPDVWFEAAILGGLMLLLWHRRPAWLAVIGAGLVLGSSATLRQVGEILVLPAAVYVACVTKGLRPRAATTALFVAAFAVPIVGYSTISLISTGHFRLSHSGSSSLYGRTAADADCATLKLASYQRGLCPTTAQQALGPDGLEHDPQSPLKVYEPPADVNRTKIITDFTHRVIAQQPLRVAVGWASDAAKLFALTRDGRPGDTPIARWQFQTSFPTFDGVIELGQGNQILRGGYQLPAGTIASPLLTPLPGSLDSRAGVMKPLASFLHGYQLRGGYTPGPLYALAVLAALAGLILGARRRAPAALRAAAAAAFAFLATAAAVLAMSDLFEFSWRYQLPALVTLPPAGALGITIILASLRRPDPAGRPDEAAGWRQRLTAPAR
jgi:hypothetical protein